MPSSAIITSMQSYWLAVLLPSATAFVPSVRPPTIPSTARPRAQPAHAFVLPPAAGIESFDQTVVGLTELLLFSGIVASYEISRTMQVHIRSGIYDPSSRRRRILATQPAIPYEKMWLAGASLPSVDELVQGCFKIAEDAAGCAHVTHLFYFTISLLTALSCPHAQPHVVHLREREWKGLRGRRGLLRVVRPARLRLRDVMRRRRRRGGAWAAMALTRFL